MKWIIAYDVTFDRARRRVARRLEQMGFRRQKSVFEGEASPGEVSKLLDELVQLVDAEHDVLTAWPWGENGPARLQHRGASRAETRKDWSIL
jgi:CRISPR-associated endonuclease Cas2